MRSIFTWLLVLMTGLIGACESTDGLDSQVIDATRLAANENKAKLIAFARLVDESKIAWMNEKAFRLENMAEALPWGSNALNDQVTQELRAILKSLNINTVAYYSGSRRVNFGFHGVGLGTSGRSVGVYVFLGEISACDSVVKKIDPRQLRLQCELIDKNIFLYRDV